MAAFTSKRKTIPAGTGAARTSRSRWKSAAPARSMANCASIGPWCSPCSRARRSARSSATTSRVAEIPRVQQHFGLVILHPVHALEAHACLLEHADRARVFLRNDAEYTAQPEARGGRAQRGVGSFER